MNFSRAASMCVVSLAAGLTGCFRTIHYVPRTQAPATLRTATVDVLKKELADRDAAIKTLKATVEITASTGGGKEGKVIEYTSLHGYIFVRKPGDLRVLMQKPVLGSSAVDMVSDGEHFTLLINGLTGSRAIVGTNKVTKPSKNGLENLRPAVFFDSLLVPGLRPDEQALLVESTHMVQSGEGRKKIVVEEAGYDLTVYRQDPGAAPRITRVVHIDRASMLPFEQDIYDAEGRVVTSAKYEDYKLSGDVQFPSVITISRPQDEYKLKVEVTKLGLNETFEDMQFELKLPPGIPVQRME